MVAETQISFLNFLVSLNGQFITWKILQSSLRVRLPLNLTETFTDNTLRLNENFDPRDTAICVHSLCRGDFPKKYDNL